uniref:Ribosomal RNA-processing protein 40 n=1 Tax=Zea mays TaxID=4577 RepID=A0A804NFS4_MAIZE
MELRRPASSPLVDNYVVPGDVVLDLSEMNNQTIKLGAGLRQECDTIQATSAGKLRQLKPNKYWIENSQKRYIPSVEDTVLGIVVDTKPDNFLVDIKGPNLAFLPVLSFEGGTRRNIPKFEIGTLIYARVVKANSIMNPELSCMDATGKAAEFGQLKDGYMFDTSTGMSRMLLSSPTCPVLEVLGKKLSFEIAVGLNGRVWVCSSNCPLIIIFYPTFLLFVNGNVSCVLFLGLCSVGECSCSKYCHSCIKCNNEVRIFERHKTKSYGRKSIGEIVMMISQQALV